MPADDVFNSLLRNSLENLRSAEDTNSQAPQLAHYTSITNLRNILSTNQLWLSNPQFMNDLHEMNYGISKGYEFVLGAKSIERGMKKDSRSWFVEQSFAGAAQQFYVDHAANVYVFCLSQHNSAASDGLLSMWRAYGAPGQGAALIFNTNFIKTKEGSPIFIAKVCYCSENDRHNSLVNLVNRWTASLANLDFAHMDDEELRAIGHSLFVAIKFHALTTKHIGFSEENEWRLIYMPDHDPQGILSKCYSYHIGVRGVEPKLKLPIAPLPLNNPATWRFDDIIDTIILGPGMQKSLHQKAIERLLDDSGKPGSKTKLHFSTIPLRV